MITTGYCKFCRLSNAIEVGQMYCKSCHVRYLFNITNNDECVCLIFFLDDPKYFCLMSDIKLNMTEIWFLDYSPKHKITIPQIFPNIKPDNARGLAKRLHKLLAFS